jgi:hypothetical protein
MKISLKSTESMSHQVSHNTTFMGHRKVIEEKHKKI